LPWTFRSTEIEDKKVDKNGLGHLGRMAKKGQLAAEQSCTLSGSTTKGLRSVFELHCNP
jgi:hypothetical protein